MGPPACHSPPRRVAAVVAAPDAFRRTSRLPPVGPSVDSLLGSFGPSHQPLSRSSWTARRPLWLLLTSGRLPAARHPQVRCMKFRHVPSGSTRCVFRCLAASLPVRIPTVVPSLPTSFALSASRDPPCLSIRLSSLSRLNTFQLISSCPCRAHEGGHSCRPLAHRSGQIIEAITSATTLMSFRRMLSEGPEVSLKGSPTVSPTTAALCASEPFFSTTPFTS